jgi:hypothetical protein
MKFLLLLFVLFFNAVLCQEPSRAYGAGKEGDAGELIPLHIVIKHYSSVVNNLDGTGVEVFELLMKASLTDDDREVVKSVLEKIDLKNEAMRTKALSLRDDSKKLSKHIDEYLHYLKVLNLVDMNERIVIERDKSCKDENGKIKDASVVKNGDINSKICLSLNALRRFPEETIDARLTGIILNEYLRLLNVSEKLIGAIYKIIITHYGQISDELFDADKNGRLDYFAKKEMAKTYFDLKSDIAHKRYANLLERLQSFEMGLESIEKFVSSNALYDEIRAFEDISSEKKITYNDAKMAFFNVETQFLTLFF